MAECGCGQTRDLPLDVLPAGTMAPPALRVAQNRGLHWCAHLPGTFSVHPCQSSPNLSKPASRQMAPVFQSTDLRFQRTCDIVGSSSSHLYILGTSTYSQKAENLSRAASHGPQVVPSSRHMFSGHYLESRVHSACSAKINAALRFYDARKLG